MEPNGDPEARIRDLERPLADRAQANELSTQPYEAAPPPYEHYGTAPPQYGSPYYAPPQRVVRKRSQIAALWLVPFFVVGFIVAGIIGIVVYFSTGSPDSDTANPEPPVSGGGGSLDAPPAPQTETRVDSTEQIVTVEAGGFLSIGGIDKNQTIVCSDGAVSISGVNNTIEVQGSCATVTVSGVDNTVAVESAQTISASGFDNRVTYRSGEPETSTSGTGNVIEQG